MDVGREVLPEGPENMLLLNTNHHQSSAMAGMLTRRESSCYLAISELGSYQMTDYFSKGFSHRGMQAILIKLIAAGQLRVLGARAHSNSL